MTLKKLQHCLNIKILFYLTWDLEKNNLTIVYNEQTKKFIMYKYISSQIKINKDDF